MALPALLLSRAGPRLALPLGLGLWLLSRQAGGAQQPEARQPVPVRPQELVPVGGRVQLGYRDGKVIVQLPPVRYSLIPWELLRPGARIIRVRLTTQPLGWLVEFAPIEVSLRDLRGLLGSLIFGR